MARASGFFAAIHEHAGGALQVKASVTGTVEIAGMCIGPCGDRGAGCRSADCSVRSVKVCVLARNSNPGAGISRRSRVFLAASIVALALGGCASAPEDGRKGVRYKTNTKEYFPTSKYGKASPRVIRNGQRVPRGGGRRIVGRPYTIRGKRYYPRKFKEGQTQVGRASWYGDAFHGRKTANGEIYDMSAISAAHPTMPLPSYARVTNLKNNRSIIVRVNDRGPYHGGRIIDLSKRVADALDFRRFGTARVKVTYLRPAGLAGSNDRKLIATLRTDGSPAQLDGGSWFGGRRTMIAAAEPAPAPRQVSKPAPKPEPAPAPQRSEPAITTVAQATPAYSSEMPKDAPVPPQRPFDLITAPGPVIAISTAPAASSPDDGGRKVAASARSSPPSRVRANRTGRARFFAPLQLQGAIAGKLEKRGPFEGIVLGRFRRPKR